MRDPLVEVEVAPATEPTVPLERPVLGQHEGDHALDAAPHELTGLPRGDREGLLGHDLERQDLETPASRLGICARRIDARVRREVADLTGAREHVERRDEARCDVGTEQLGEREVPRRVRRVRAGRHQNAPLEDLRARARHDEPLVDRR